MIFQSGFQPRCRTRFLPLCLLISAALKSGAFAQKNQPANPPNQTLQQRFDELKSRQTRSKQQRVQSVRKRHQRLDAAIRTRSMPREKRRENLELAISELQAIIETRQKVLGSVSAPRDDSLAQLRELNHRYQRLARNRSQWTQAFLEFPHESRGAVRSGRALNHLFRQDGESIAQAAFLLTSLQTERRRLEKLKSAKEPKSTETSNRIAKVDEQIRILKSLLSGRSIPRHLLDKINLRMGSSQVSSVVNLSRGALAINWQLLHALPYGRFEDHQDTIETLKAMGLQELTDNGRVSTETSRLLRAATENLIADFRDLRSEYKSSGTLSQFISGTNTNLMYQSKNMLQQLRLDVATLVTAQSIHDVVIDEKFEGNKAHELIVYMNRHGMSFNEAQSTDGFAAYEFLFAELARLHVDIRVFLASMQRDEEELTSELNSLLDQDKNLLTRWVKKSDDETGWGDKLKSQINDLFRKFF